MELKGKWGLPGEKLAWREDYNEFRPHSSLGGLTPRQFAEQFLGQKTIFMTGPVFG
ncbi:MAG: integrase core domain-containing protein [Acidobacteria bacterium]|nr:integrase core domain-containing protein [Acidobacteriota bacterium]MBU4495776.1 integrase core domain-containing protein [Acidobacteriota bacterium]